MPDGSKERPRRCFTQPETVEEQRQRLPRVSDVAVDTHDSNSPPSSIQATFVVAHAIDTEHHVAAAEKTPVGDSEETDCDDVDVEAHDDHLAVAKLPAKSFMELQTQAQAEFPENWWREHLRQPNTVLCFPYPR
jgi:hypothetical protein